MSIRIDPIYKANIIGQQKLDRWNFYAEDVVVEEQPLDYSHRSKGSVRYVVAISEKSQRYLEKYAYDLTDLMTATGSWMGLWALGLALLSYWQLIVRPFGFPGIPDIDTFALMVSERKNEKSINKLEAILHFFDCCCKRREPTRLEGAQPTLTRLQTAQLLDGARRGSSAATPLNN